MVTTAELLTTELFSNALLHGTGPIMLSVSVAQREVRGEVSGASPADPVVARPGPDAVSGRGLMLVDALAQKSGVVRRPESSGKVVWFTLTAVA